AVQRAGTAWSMGAGRLMARDYAGARRRRNASDQSTRARLDMRRRRDAEWPAMTDDLALMPAHVLAEAVRRRELSPVAVVEGALGRIERLNPALNAFVALRADAALAEARALEGRLARGEDPGPLAGVPFGVKDLENLAGLPTTHGSVPFRNQMAKHDSTQVARLRRAGAIALGKTNTPEFGYTAFTKNRI